MAFLFSKKEKYMRKNIKHSILSVIIIVIALSLAVMLLTAAKPVEQIKFEPLSVSVDENKETEEDSIKVEKELKYNSKSSMLGMGIFSTDTPSVFEGYVDTLLSNGFSELRIDIPNYQNTAWLERSKEAVKSAVAKGAKVIWGVSSYNISHSEYTITAENWPAFRQAILDNAKWAQDNGVYEFQLGNEEEMHIWRHPISIVRTKNIATVTFEEDHGFTSANPVTIWGGNPSNFNAYSANPVVITLVGPKTFTYPSIGNDGPVSNPRKTFIGNMPEDTIQAKIKALAIEVQDIFTRGNISYTASSSYFMNKWHEIGRGDIDILAWNVYANQNEWQNTVTNMVNWWGPDNSYITEFSLNYKSLDAYSTDETKQASGLTSMIEYIQTSGVSRAYYFCYKDTKFGILKSDGTYRSLWNNAILS
jgi:hypothetical protein